MNPDVFSPSRRALWSNWLWFFSLILSLTVALIAILAKQWITQYRSRMRAHVASTRAWVWRHRAFHKGLEDFHFTTIISTLPLIMHMALFAFFSGLAVYLIPLHFPIALAMGGGTAVAFIVYLGLCVVVPIVRGDCPMSTPIVDHMQYFGYRIRVYLVWLGYRIAMEWRHTVRLCFRHSLPPADIRPRPETRDIETYLEDRLFGGDLGPRLSADALLWMLQHFRDYNHIIAALEAIGALDVYRHHGAFSTEELTRLRNMVIWRAEVLAQRPDAEVAAVERASLMRTALFTQIVARTDDPQTLSQGSFVDRCTSDIGHDTRFMRAALIGTRQALLQSLVSFQIGDNAQIPSQPIDKPGLALWSARATERLVRMERLAGDRVGHENDLSLHHLGVLLWSIIQSSTPDDLGSHVRAAPTSSLDKPPTVFAVPYNVLLARRITACASNIIAYQDRFHLFQGAEEGFWLLEALPIWSTALSLEQSVDSITALRSLYDKMLAQLSQRTAPIRDGQLKYALQTISFFETGCFSDASWTDDALYGALDLILRLHRHFDTGGLQMDSWRNVLSATCSLLIYVEAIRREIVPAWMSRVVKIVRVLGSRRSDRWTDSNGTAGAHEIVPTGRLALLYRPEARMSEPAGSPPIPHVQSIWTSACSFMPEDDDRLLFQVAKSIVEDLRPIQTFVGRGDTTSMLRTLLQCDRVIRFTLLPDGRDLFVAVAKISHREWARLAARLRMSVSALDIHRRQQMDRLVREVDAASHEQSPMEIFWRRLTSSREPTPRRWSSVRAAMRAGSFRRGSDMSIV